MIAAGKIWLIHNVMSFTCSGLGLVILWDGVLLSPEGNGGGGEGGASPPKNVLWLGARSVGRGSKGREAAEGGGPCNVSATYVPAMGQKVKESVKWTETYQIQTKKGFV